MGERTKISWADHTGNPWVGCTVAHAGCLNCYARDFSQKKHGKVRGPWALWGPGQNRLVTKGFWTDAPKWARQAAKDGMRRTIFPSLMDPLDAEVYERREAPEGVACRATFDRFMQTIRETGRVSGGPGILGTMRGGLTWLLLTKRPENWRWISEDVRPYCWLLYSASDQPSLDAGTPHILAAEGFAGLGLSLEPLVGSVDIVRSVDRSGLQWGCDGSERRRGARHHGVGSPECPHELHHHHDARCRFPLRWIICAGESGPHFRPCEVDWIADVAQQGRRAGAAVYVKQDAATRPGQQGRIPDDLWALKEFPEGLR